MRPARLPIAVPPARCETLASYLARLASLHGISPGELAGQISARQPGTPRHAIDPGRLAVITGRPARHLGLALPELRDPEPDWRAWRHQPQPSCPRCDARHDGGPVTRLLPHHRYVCTRHRYWIGPPDAGQPATPLDPGLDSVVQAQRRHLRLLGRHGAAVTHDAVLTGFLICGHLWADRPGGWPVPWQRWTRRAEVLIPPGAEPSQFSAARIFAAAYPEAVRLGSLIASPRWRGLAAGDTGQRQQFIAEIGRRLGRPGYQPPDLGDAIAHWMKFDSLRPPSRPHATFPQTRGYRSARPAATTSPHSLQRHERSALWFQLYRRGGRVILHHGHIRPVLIRDWSPPMDGITATIWASQTTMHLGRHPDRAGEVSLTFQARWPSIGVWDVRGKPPDRARPGAAVDYGQVFRDAAPGLWRTIYAFAAGRRAMADDAVAEAFARALEHAGQIRDPVPWLYRTAFRIAVEDLRRERREPELEPELEPERDQAAAAAGLAALVPALRQLSPAERAAVVLHYEADLPVQEVARRMGTSAGAVKVHLFRGRRRLRELLGDEEVDDA